MNWNDIQAQWKRTADPSASIEAAELVPARPIWRIIRRRDGLESVVGVLLALFFAGISVLLFQATLPLPALFALWLTLVCIYIPLRLRRARQMIPTPDPGQPVIEFLRAERAALVGQAQMLSSVWLWYWGPIAVGTIGFYVSVTGWNTRSLAYVAFVIAVCAGVEYLNRKAVRHSIAPAIAAVDQQIADLIVDLEDKHEP